MSFSRKILSLIDRLTFDHSFILILVVFLTVFSLALIELGFQIFMGNYDKAWAAIPHIMLSLFLISMYANLNMELTAIKKLRKKRWRTFHHVNTDSLAGVSLNFDDRASARTISVAYDKKQRTVSVKGDCDFLTLLYDTPEGRKEVMLCENPSPCSPIACQTFFPLAKSETSRKETVARLVDFRPVGCKGRIHDSNNQMTGAL